MIAFSSMTIAMHDSKQFVMICYVYYITACIITFYSVQDLLTIRLQVYKKLVCAHWMM